MTAAILDSDSERGQRKRLAAFKEVLDHAKVVCMAAVDAAPMTERKPLYIAAAGLLEGGMATLAAQPLLCLDLAAWSAPQPEPEGAELVKGVSVSAEPGSLAQLQAGASLTSTRGGGGTLAIGVGALMASVLTAPVDSKGCAADLERIRRLISTIKEGKLV